jgi:fluoroacetyl-CoA thioesterase
MLDIGATAEAGYVAGDADMADAVEISAQDHFPQVFSTSRMIAMMEVAASRVLIPLLQPGQLSVGVVVNIKHLAATPNHTRVWATASYLGMEGKLYRFRVEAFDPGGKIGEGEHCRAIISLDRLMQGAKARVDGKQ